jgi:hypothetical protein
MLISTSQFRRRAVASAVMTLLHGADYVDATGRHTWSAHGASISTVGGHAGIALDGSTSYLDTPPSGDFNLTGDFTIEAKVWWSSDSNNFQQILACGYSAGWAAPCVGFLLFGRSSGVASFQRGLAAIASNTGLGAYGPSVPTGEWVHVCAQRSGSTVRVYVNGVSGDPATWSDPVDFTYGGAYSPYIGWGAWDGAQGRLAGVVRELKVTKAAVYTMSGFTPP